MQFSDLPSLSVRRPTLVVVTNLLIVIAGFAALFDVEVRELPDVDRPWSRFAPSLMGPLPKRWTRSTSVIDSAVARVSGVKAINAASEENNARVRPEFSPNTDLDTGVRLARELDDAADQSEPIPPMVFQ